MWWLPDFGAGRVNYAIRIVTYVPFFLLMLLGTVSVFQNRAFWTPAWLVVHLTMFATFATVLIFFGEPRFRDANAALLMVYAALGIRHWNRIGPKRETKVAAVSDTSQICPV